MRFHIAFSLLVTSLTTRVTFARIPQEVEDKQQCAMRKYSDAPMGRRGLSLYDEDNDIHHRFRCEWGVKYPIFSQIICKKCPLFLALDNYDSVEEKLTDDEYGLNMGIYPGREKKLEAYAFYWIGPFVDGDNLICDNPAIWNILLVRNYNDENQHCQYNLNLKFLTFSWSYNHNRGFPLAVFIDSKVNKPEYFDFVWKGCASPDREDGNICVRLVNTRILGEGKVREVQPDDVVLALKQVKKALTTKAGGETGSGRAEHPRQTLNYCLLGLSIFLILAVIASIFAVPKQHDFPIMYQKGVATVGKKPKKVKKKEKKTSTGLGGQTSAGLTGIGKSNKTAKTSKTGKAGKTKGSMKMKDDKKGKKDKKKKGKK